MPNSIPDTRRQEIFRTLVETQDGGTTVVQSRERVASRYEIEVEQLIAIEREGVKAKWPPLNIPSPAPRLTPQLETSDE